MLTQKERDLWNACAKEEHKRREGIHGIHLFEHSNAPVHRNGLPLVTRLPRKPGFGLFSAAGIKARNHGGRFTLAVRNATNDIEPDWYIVSATPPVGPGQTPKENDRIVILPKATRADLADLGAAYLRVFRKNYGLPQPDQRLGVWVAQCTQGYRNGQWHRFISVTA